MLNIFAKKLRAMQEVSRDERGFTLIELLIVVIIIGILAAIAIPTFLAQRDKAEIAACRSDTRNAAEAATLYAAGNDPVNDYSGATIALLTAEGFNQTDGHTTTITGTPGANIDLSTACAGGVGTVTFSTTGANAGQVDGP